MPEMHGINNTTGCLESCSSIFEQYIFGYLVAITSEYAAEFVPECLDWGYLITICNDEVVKIN